MIIQLMQLSDKSADFDSRFHILIYSFFFSFRVRISMSMFPYLFGLTLNKIMQINIYLHVFLALFLFPIINCDMVPIIRVEMSKHGFHRDLQYTVEFDYPLAGKDCEYYLEQKLPPAVYVNVDQLNDLKRLKKLNAIYPTFIDVEIPTEKANPFTVLLHGAPKITDNIKLPIHFRYHSPGEKSFVSVEISPPQMFMRCPDDDLANYDELLEDPNNNFCLDENEFTLPQNSAPDYCDWKLLKKTTRLKAPLVAKIPIGSSQSYPPILYATIVISWAASIWFVFGTHPTPRKINNKLEQQRVLDKKYN